MESKEDPRLIHAISVIRRGERVRARALLRAVLADDPRNLSAWLWACEVAPTREERINCLRHILAIDPSHEGARHYLDRLGGEIAPPKPLPRTPQPPKRPPRRIRLPKRPAGRSTTHSEDRGWLMRLLLLPFEAFVKLPLTWLLVILLLLGVMGGYVYFYANTSFFGLAGPDFDSLTISDTYEEIAAQDMHWKVVFEREGSSTFAGVVRHVSPIRVSTLRIATHDILVTSGDYADPDLVDTRVSNHRFRWRCNCSTRPEGHINLLHTLPADEEIYQQLLSIRAWDTVTITGREILYVEAYDEQGETLGRWQDAGCNTLLVQGVEIGPTR